jgi:hypothetical protein
MENGFAVPFYVHYDEGVQRRVLRCDLSDMVDPRFGREADRAILLSGG